LPGPISATIYASSTTPETELVAELEDVTPSGASYPLTEGAPLGSLRAINRKRSWTIHSMTVLPYHPHTRPSARAVKPGVVAERLEAHDRSPSRRKDAAMQATALGLNGVIRALPDTPVRLATAAFAFENLEVAAYRLIRSLAERAGDEDTVAVVERILEEEEAAAELVAGTFERSVELLLHEPAQSPLVGVTPIGKPSERPTDRSEHEGPQSFKSTPADEPAHPPRDIETPVPPLTPPEPGYPADQTEPHGGNVSPPRSPAY
jgi:acylphosphatase